MLSAIAFIRAFLALKSGIPPGPGGGVPSTWLRRSINALVTASVFLMAASALVLPTTASVVRAENSLEAMRAAAEKITSIKGDFVQEKHMPILARPLIAHGYFAYQRPSSLRWEYRKPLKSVLLLHDGNVNRYIHTEKGWQEDAAANLQSMDFILQEISNWLNGRFEDNPLFHAAVGKDRTVILTPKEKSMDQFIRRIELVMAAQPGVLKQVTIYEGEDTFTRFSFVHPHINDSISPSEFRKIQ
jgi:outer membrane lipoprotein-sorting protein